MVKFGQLSQSDVKEILDCHDNSNVHDWFKGWITIGMEKHPKQDVSQASFQRYLDKREDVPEDCTAYAILKELKARHNYAIFKQMRLVAPAKKEEEKVEKKEPSYAEDVSEAETPKIITCTQPQTIVLESKPYDFVEETNNKTPWMKKIVITVFALTIAAIAIGLIIKYVK